MRPLYGTKEAKKIMRNFDNDFQKARREFDRDFKRTQVFILVSWLFFAVIGLGTTGFVIWVTVKLLQYFGVV